MITTQDYHKKSVKYSHINPHRWQWQIGIISFTSFWQFDCYLHILTRK